MQFVTALLAAALLSVSAKAEMPENYSFISGDDLYDALSQESMVLQGYTLGVVDSLKHSTNPDDCFVIPLRPDADQVIYAGFLEFWRDNPERPASAVAAIALMMRSEFACETQ
jgi:hypothetical protein